MFKSSQKLKKQSKSNDSHKPTLKKSKSTKSITKHTSKRSLLTKRVQKIEKMTKNQKNNQNSTQITPNIIKSQFSSFSTSISATSPIRHNHTVRPRRSLLYIPGSSIKMLGKSLTCGADTVCLDVEDGVALSSKALGRTQISNFLDENLKNFPQNMEVCLRINAVSSGDEYLKDIEWLNELKEAPHSIALPKMDTVNDFKTFIPILKNLEKKHQKRIQLIGMIESPRAVINLPFILEESLNNDNNHEHLTALIFGGDDYSSMSGCLRTTTNHELDFPRAMVQMHASAHNIGCLDIVCKEFKDLTRFQIESQKSVENGYIGRQCIHPSQIQPANEIYAPTVENFEWANGVVQEFKTQTDQGIGAFTYRGMMIDMPTIKRADNILIRAQACGMKM